MSIGRFKKKLEAFDDLGQLLLMDKSKVKMQTNQICNRNLSLLKVKGQCGEQQLPVLHLLQTNASPLATVKAN